MSAQPRLSKKRGSGDDEEGRAHQNKKRKQASTGMTMDAVNNLLEEWTTTEKHMAYDNMHDILQAIRNDPTLLDGVSVGIVRF